MSTARQFRDLVASGGTQVLPGASNALTARILEDVGFQAIYATGAGITNSAFAKPDLGLLSMTEAAEEVRRICRAVSVPVIADADTGFGGVHNVAGTVEAYERAGVAGVQLEDQTFPKRCGHFTGTEVVPEREMLQRLHAAQRARRDPDLVLVARTDALASHGLEEAIRRANAYRAAGADVIFVEAPRSTEQLREIGARVRGPLIANMVEGGRTPMLPSDELGALGYAFVLHANTALRLSIEAVRSGMLALRRTGDSSEISDQISSWEERQRLVKLDEHLAFEQEVAAETGPHRSNDHHKNDARESRKEPGTEVPK